jgi:hypothetical protein
MKAFYGAICSGLRVLGNPQSFLLPLMVLLAAACGTEKGDAAGGTRTVVGDSVAPLRDRVGDLLLAEADLRLSGLSQQGWFVTADSLQTLPSDCVREPRLGQTSQANRDFMAGPQVAASVSVTIYDSETNATSAAKDTERVASCMRAAILSGSWGSDWHSPELLPILSPAFGQYSEANRVKALLQRTRASGSSTSEVEIDVWEVQQGNVTLRVAIFNIQALGGTPARDHFLEVAFIKLANELP